MHPLLKYILWPLCLYIAYCALLFFLQRQIMFPRAMIQQPAPSSRKIPGLEKWWLDSGVGQTEAWFMPPLSDQVTGPGPVPAVIFGHGNGELIDYWPDELYRFTRLGLALLLVEYPGYGRSEGSPSQKSITQAFVAAHDRLSSNKNIDRSRIIFFGRSLGGGAVCALAAQRPSAAMILMSTFTSARSFAKRYLAPNFLVKDPFDNLSVVKNYKKPILIIHGVDDTIIPFSHGTALHKAAVQGKLVTYKAGHNDCPPDWNVFWQDIETFLRGIGLI